MKIDYNWKLALKGLVFMGVLLGCLWMLSGCLRLPEGYVVDESAQEVLDVGEKVDTFLPVGLDVLAAFGVPFVGLIASVIRSRKLGRVLANTVLSVQHARKAVQDNGIGGVLGIVDNALRGSQTGETIAYVKKIKDDLGAMSVNSSTS